MFRVCAIVLAVVICTGASDSPTPPALRWVEGSPNCTFRAGDDGHTYYGISSGDFEITLAVDRQELEMVRHRALPVFGVFLSFQYKGGGQLRVRQHSFALEFVQHRSVVQSSLDSGLMLTTLQNDIDETTYQAEKHERKHPEDKAKQAAELQARLNDYKEMLDFVSTHALHARMLDQANPSVSGWVFFSTENRWVGAWHRPEQFVLRLPIENVVVEFPFELPPKAGKVELRQRSRSKP